MLPFHISPNFYLRNNILIRDKEARISKTNHTM